MYQSAYSISSPNTHNNTDLLDNLMFDNLIDKLLIAVSYLPQFYLLIKTVLTLRQPISSKPLLLTWVVYFLFILVFKFVAKTWRLQTNMTNWIETFGCLIIIAIPYFVYQKLINVLVSIRSSVVKMHPFTLYTKIKHKSAINSIQKSIKSINKSIKLLTDEQRKQVRDQILITIFDQHPKNLTQEGVQCQIISIKPTQIKQLKTIDVKPVASIMKSTPLTQIPVIQKKQILNKFPVVQKKQHFQKKQEPKINYAERTPVITGGIQKYYSSPRTPITSSMNLKRSDVLVTQQTPPKYRTIQTMPIDTQPINHFKKKAPQKGDLSQKLNVSMSVYSDLLDDQEQIVYQQPILQKKVTSPSKPIKKLISKVQIYMQSVIDPSKLQKLYIALYQGDQIQILTLTNTVMQVIILLKIIELNTGYFEAKGYSSVAGMCSKVFKFKGDYSAFNKYIQHK